MKQKKTIPYNAIGSKTLSLNLLLVSKKQSGSSKYEYMTMFNSKSFSKFGFSPKIEKLW